MNKIKTITLLLGLITSGQVQAGGAIKACLVDTQSVECQKSIARECAVAYSTCELHDACETVNEYTYDMCIRADLWDMEKIGKVLNN